MQQNHRLALVPSRPLGDLKALILLVNHEFSNPSTGNFDGAPDKGAVHVGATELRTVDVGAPDTGAKYEDAIVAAGARAKNLVSLRL